jgi:phospholipase C
MDGVFRIDFRNDSRTPAEFEIRSAPRADTPRSYTVEAGDSLFSWWEGAAGTGEYDVTVHGPNGFFRNFRGTLSGADSCVVDAPVTRRGSRSFPSGCGNRDPVCRNDLRLI